MIEFRNEEGRVFITSPYNKDFIREVKGISGKWHADQKQWSVPEKNIEKLSNLCVEIYGFTPLESSEKITVRYKAVDFDKQEEGIKIGGKVTAKRFSRDSDVVFYDTEIIEGKFYGSGGSKHYPMCKPADNVILESKISKQVYDNLEDKDRAKLEIVSEESEIEKLLKEKEALLKKLEIVENKIKELEEKGE